MDIVKYLQSAFGSNLHSEIVKKHHQNTQNEIKKMDDLVNDTAKSRRDVDDYRYLSQVSAKNVLDTVLESLESTGTATFKKTGYIPHFSKTTLYRHDVYETFEMAGCSVVLDKFTRSFYGTIDEKDRNYAQIPSACVTNVWNGVDLKTGTVVAEFLRKNKFKVTDEGSSYKVQL